MEKRTQIKQKLIALGYLDNEFLDKYLDLIFLNVDTEHSNRTQAHHVIPVTNYWTSSEVYNRTEAVKLSNADPLNFTVNLLYSDHLLVHAYLTLCTNLVAAQAKYDLQADIRKRNGKIGFEKMKQTFDTPAKLEAKKIEKEKRHADKLAASAANKAKHQEIIRIQYQVWESDRKKSWGECYTEAVAIYNSKHPN